MLENFKKAIQSPSASKLLTASLTSRIGDWFYVTAIYALVAKAGGYSALAFMATFRHACSIFLTPLGAIFVDKLPKKQVMIASDIFRFSTMCGLAWSASAASPSVLLLTVFSCATAIGSIFFSPARAALLPLTVDKQSRSALNAIDGTAGTLILTVAPAVAGALLAVLDCWVIILLNAFTFLISAGFILAIKLPKTSNSSSSDSKKDTGTTNWREEAFVGIKGIYQTPGVLMITLFAFAIHIGVGATWIFIPSFSLSLGLDSSGVGYLTAAIGVGSVLGMITGGSFLEKNHSKVMLGSVLLFSISMALWCIGSTNVELAFTGAVLLGFFANTFEAPCWTFLQNRINPSNYARVFSVFDAIALTGLLIGSNIAAYSANNRNSMLGTILTALSIGIVWITAISLHSILKRRVEPSM